MPGTSIELDLGSSTDSGTRMITLQVGQVGINEIPLPS